MSLMVAAMMMTAAIVQDHSAHADHVAQAAPTKRSMIKASVPADGAMLPGPPAAFEVTFVHPMTLKTVTIADQAGKAVAVTAQPVVVDASSARIALPKLAPGTYKLAWVGVGGSGREMRGDISFMVH